MKFFSNIVLLLSVVMLVSCEDSLGIKCDAFGEGLIYFDRDIIQPQVNKFLADLHPKPVTDDICGHEMNLNIFAARIEKECGLEVVVDCYACIETYPPLSHVTIRLDSIGAMVTRTLDIVTPEDKEMTFRDIHL